MSGGSRGIGLAIALRAARDGANIVIAAKTADPDPRLEGTIHTARAALQADFFVDALPGMLRADNMVNAKPGL